MDLRTRHARHVQQQQMQQFAQAELISAVQVSFGKPRTVWTEVLALRHWHITRRSWSIDTLLRSWLRLAVIYSLHVVPLGTPELARRPQGYLSIIHIQIRAALHRPAGLMVLPAVPTATSTC